jgi:SAM-dependent methyltransferase
MIPLDYLALRLVRRHLPDRVVRELLARRIVIKPGLETTDPAAAIQRFLDAMRAAGTSVAGRRVLIFGYGGSYGVGLGLLRAGARHVVLVDPYAVAVPAVNRALAEGSPYLTVANGEVRPRPEFLTIVNAPLRSYLGSGGEPVDIVLSNSVLEHVGDVAGAVPELARVTARGGEQFHFVDLRDHFFKHPFEMLCHSEQVWRGVLNPGSNLNRLRVWDYERIFRASFPRVTVEPLAADLPAFRAVRARIRPEFLSGDEERDAVTRIFVWASVD